MENQILFQASTDIREGFVSMARLCEGGGVVGQPFRLGPGECAIFQAANQWTVFYLRFPDGEWMHMPHGDWDRLASPVWIDPELLTAGNGVLGKTQFVPIGLLVDHRDFGRGYVTVHEAKSFEVCFAVNGPKRLPFSREWTKMKAIRGVGTCFPESTADQRAHDSGRRKNSAATKTPAPATPLTIQGDTQAGKEPTPHVRPPMSASPNMRQQTQGTMQAAEASSSLGLTFGLPPRSGSYDRRPCSCAGGNENCVRCDGTGWIRPSSIPQLIGNPVLTNGVESPAKPKSRYRSPDSTFFDRPPLSGSGSTARKFRKRTAGPMIRCALCGSAVRQTRLAAHENKCPKRRNGPQKPPNPKRK